MHTETGTRPKTEPHATFKTFTIGAPCWTFKLLLNLYALKMLSLLLKVLFYPCHGHAEKWKQKCNVKAERVNSRHEQLISHSFLAFLRKQDHSSAKKH